MPERAESKVACPTCGGRGWHTAAGNDPMACGRCPAGEAWSDARQGKNAIEPLAPVDRREAALRSARADARTRVGQMAVSTADHQDRVRVGDAYLSVRDPGVEQFVEIVGDEFRPSPKAYCLGPMRHSWISCASLLDPKKYRLVERDGKRC